MTCACGALICYICRKVQSAVFKGLQIFFQVLYFQDITGEGYKHFCQTPHCNHKQCGRFHLVFPHLAFITVFSSEKCSLFTDTVEDDRRAMYEAGLTALKDQVIHINLADCVFQLICLFCLVFCNQPQNNNTSSASSSSSTAAPTAAQLDINKLLEGGDIKNKVKPAAPAAMPMAAPFGGFGGFPFPGGGGGFPGGGLGRGYPFGQAMPFGFGAPPPPAGHQMLVQNLAPAYPAEALYARAPRVNNNRRRRR